MLVQDRERAGTAFPVLPNSCRLNVLINFFARKNSLKRRLTQMTASPIPEKSLVRAKSIGARQLLPAGIALCLVAGVWAVAPARFKHRSGAAITPVLMPNASPGTADSSSMLAGIPIQTGTGASDMAIRKGMDKAHQTPANDKVWTGLGDALMQKARETADTHYYDYAEKAYNQALAIKPANADAMTGLAWVNGGRHQFDDSISWANKALAIEPGNNIAYGLISDAEVERGEYDAAYEHTQKMIDLRPDLSSYSRGAYLLYVTGDNRKARWLMAKAIGAGSTFAENTAWCRTQLAQILFSDGNLLAAEQVAADALQKNPQNFHVIAMMGKIKAAKKDYPGAVDLYKKALAISPEHITMVALGDVYTAMGNKDEAAKIYAQVEELHSKNNVTGTAHDHMQMAQFYADHDKMPAEAVRLAEEHKTSKNVFESDILAWAYYKNGQLPQAKVAIDRAMKYHTADSRFYYHAGMIYAGLGNPTVAKRFLYQALSLNANFSPLATPLASREMQALGSVAVKPTTPIPANAYPTDDSFFSVKPVSRGANAGVGTTSANTNQAGSEPMPGVTK